MNIIEEFKIFLEKLEKNHSDDFFTFKKFFLFDSTIDEYCDMLNLVVNGKHKIPYHFVYCESFINSTDYNLLFHYVKYKNFKLVYPQNLDDSIISYNICHTDKIKDIEWRFGCSYPGCSYDMSTFKSIFYNLGGFFIIKDEDFLNTTVNNIKYNSIDSKEYVAIRDLVFKWIKYSYNLIYKDFIQDMNFKYFESNKKACVMSNEYISYDFIKSLKISRTSLDTRFIKLNRIYERG